MPPRRPEKLRRGDREPLRALDGSSVLELVHPGFSGADRQSLAEARLEPGGATIAHLHRRAEEIYSFTSGRGRMLLGEREFEVEAGDSVVIPPGTPHRLLNTGEEALVLLCCCAPAYADEDTELLE